MKHLKNYIGYINERYFDSTLPKNTKKMSKRYVGKNVTWYGDPEQMIVLDKEQIIGMYGNIYVQDKMDYLINLIEKSEENIELECSYGIGGLITLTDIIEEQQSYHTGDFDIDYENKNDPSSIGYEELDAYIGNEDYFVDNFAISDEAEKFFKKHKFTITKNKHTPKNLKIVFTSKEDEDEEAFEDFIEKELDIKEAIENEDGDINFFEVQLRDGHHRVFAAIKAGEDKVCVNLDKDSIKRFKGHYTLV